MVRIVADLTFQNWDVAVDAADKLRELDYEVVIDPERIDLYSNAVFAQAFKVVPRADHEMINACFDEVNAVVPDLKAAADAISAAEVSS
jgi:hypothetical protein